MSSIKSTARVAGLLYLLNGFLGYFCLMYVPGKLIVHGDAAATAANLAASPGLFRAGIVVGLGSVVIYMVLAYVLYRLFEGVSRFGAATLLTLVLLQVPLAFANQVASLGALVVARGPDFLAVFDKPQRDALVMLLLNLDTQGIFVSEIFWGLWLFPFGLLVYRSGFLPRVLGVWLVVNGAAYVALSLFGLLAPELYPTAFQWSFPFLLGEPAIMLWLTIVGARPRATGAAPLPVASG